MVYLKEKATLTLEKNLITDLCVYAFSILCVLYAINCCLIARTVLSESF